MLVSPHGSDQCQPLLIESTSSLLQYAQSLKSIVLSEREKGDLLMLGLGGFTPLTGFMGKQDWHSVCSNMQLSNGTFWPIPITLSVTQDESTAINIGDEYKLVSEQGELLGVISVSEKYEIDKAQECHTVFGTDDIEHPGVKMVIGQGEVNIAGDVKVVNLGQDYQKYSSLMLSPVQMRQEFTQRGWSQVAALQLRNPMHRAHEQLARTALEVSDGVLIHSLLGQLKPGDIPANTRVKAIDTLLKHYFVQQNVLHAGYPLAMRYAGPREALLHAVFRQNYGCSHLIVGRDHAGVGSYYGPYDAQKIFDQIPQGSLAIKPLKMEVTFWCDTCDGMASMKTCPHDDSVRVSLSGTRLRELLATNQDVPEHFSRPEVLAILKTFYQQKELSWK